MAPPPKESPKKSTRMMILVNDDIDSLNLEEALPLLPAWRREQALRYRHDTDRRLCAAAYMLLCRGLEAEYGITEAPEFGYGEGGKPFILGRPDIHFSLSHCPAAALCAVGDSAVGADIETVRPYNARLARRALSPAEVSLVEASADRAVAFARLWTMKESLLKLTGEGIRRDLKSALCGAAARFSTTVNAGRGYVFTICTET